MTTTTAFYTTLTSDFDPLATDTSTLTTTTTTTNELDIPTTLHPTSTFIDVVSSTTTLPRAPTETLICDLNGGENTIAVNTVFHTKE